MDARADRIPQSQHDCRKILKHDFLRMQYPYETGARFSMRLLELKLITFIVYRHRYIYCRSFSDRAFVPYLCGVFVVNR